MTSLNSFGSKMTLNVQGRELTYYSLRADALSALGVDRLPYSIKVLLENLLRHEDGVKVNAADIEALARWGDNPSRHGEAAGDDAKEIAFTPERVLMQDLTGVPAVVDLASMRDAIIALGGDPNKINPLVPVELVIDHSVILERSGTAESFEQNVAIEYERNVERYTFLKWAQSSFEKFRVVPPGMGICHQVNLEHLARVVFEQDGVAYLDTLVGTDSHTTMVNGLGVLGWGVGGIEAEAGMLGQPTSMLIPPVVGLRLSGAPREGVTATDVVLTITELLRKHGVVGKFVEAYGPGVTSLSLETRATIGNMSPEYGATCAIFPIDQLTVDYLAFTGRTKEQLDLVEAYAKVQGLWHDHSAAEPVYSEYVELDLTTVEPSLAGTEATAGPRVTLRRARRVPRRPRSRTQRGARRRDGRDAARGRRRRRRDHVVHEHLEPLGVGRGRPGRQARRRTRTQREALGEDVARPGQSRRHGLPRAGRPREAPRRAGLLPRGLRVHDVHRQHRSAAGRGLRSRQRARPLGRVGAVGQPQLRGSHPPRRQAELPRQSAARRGLRPRRDDGDRPRQRTARRRHRREAGVPGRPLAE